MDEVTSTVTVQVLDPAAAFTPVPPMVKVPVPAAAVMVGAPPQLLTTLGVAAMSTLAGSASLKVRLVRAGAAAGLVIVKVSVDTCPTPIVAGANALVSAGRLCTVRQLFVTAFVILAIEPMFAAPFVCVAGSAPQLLLVVPDVTSTVMTHDAWALLSDAPVTVTVPEPATAVTTPVPDGQ